MPSSKSLIRPKPNQSTLHHEWAFKAIGTHFWVGIYESCAADMLQKIQAQISERVESFDRTYSRFRDDSLVTQVSHQAGSYTFPSDAAQLFAFYDELYDATKGRVTPLIGQLLSDAGYDAAYSLQPKPKLAAVPDWRKVCSFKDGTLTTTQPVLLDFGAAGKGYLVDILIDIIRSAGIRAFCVDGSGDMRCEGLSTPLKIGLENPYDTSQVIGVAELQTGALCASSGARRVWSGYNHIMDPTTQSSPTDIAAVWAVADDCMTADGLTTALYFAEPAKLAANFNFEYVMLLADGRVKSSSTFPAELFIVQANHA